MDKAIANRLFQMARREHAQALAKWRSMPARTPEKQYEAQRLCVAAWYEACQELYAMAHPDERILTPASLKRVNNG